MRLLLDTNILVPLLDGSGRELPSPIRDTLRDADAALWCSAASIWEIAIKHRLGKLPLPIPLHDCPAGLTTINVRIMPVTTAHVLQLVEPAPRTRDPFDRLLLAVCAAEMMLLVTRDEKLADHPLAWRAA